MTSFLKLVPAVFIVLAGFAVSSCNSTGGINADSRDEINRLNQSRERLSPGR